MLLQGGGGAFHRIYPGELPGEDAGRLVYLPVWKSGRLIAASPRADSIYVGPTAPTPRGAIWEASPGGALRRSAVSVIWSRDCVSNTQSGSHIKIGLIGKRREEGGALRYKVQPEKLGGEKKQTLQQERKASEYYRQIKQNIFEFKKTTKK